MSKTYLIVGGSSGIGLSLSQLLSPTHNILSWSRHQPELPAVEWSEVDVMAGDLPEVPDELHGVVYAPGSINLKPFRSLREEDFLEDWKINFLGAVRVLQHCESALKKGNGSVVLFSTVAVGTGMPFHASIAGAKGAVEGLVRSLAAEWAPKVRVNAVAPSLTDTPLAERLLRNDKQREASADRHPLKRIGSPADIAHAVAYLLGEESSWVTGQVLPVDGGMSALR